MRFSVILVGLMLAGACLSACGTFQVPGSRGVKATCTAEMLPPLEQEEVK